MQLKSTLGRSGIVAIVALFSVLACAGPASAHHRRHHRKHHHHRRHHHHPAPAAAAPTTPPVAPAPTTPPPVTSTPVTVANVCHLNAGLGPIHFAGGSVPAAYWTYGNGAVRLLAMSVDGDTAVDEAGAFSADGTLTYVAQCGWSVWVAAPAQAQTGTSVGIPGAVNFIWAANQYFSPITPDGPGCAGPYGIDGGTCYPG